MKPVKQQKFSLQNWVNLLKQGKGIYSRAELQRLTGLSIAALDRALTRLCQARFLIRLGKSFYANGFNPPALEEAAALLYPPAYVSLESALFMHGVLQQAPHVLTCVTINKTKVFHTGLGEIVYSHLKPELFFGYGARDRIVLAEPEKAALDFVYLQMQNGFLPALDEWNWEHLNLPRLEAMMQNYPATVKKAFKTENNSKIGADKIMK
jgi:hypothetical protein